jgi:type IV secretion system protein VirD4
LGLVNAGSTALPFQTSHWSYTPEQKEEVKKALAAGVPKATILTYFYPEVTVEKMSSYRNKN